MPRATKSVEYKSNGISVSPAVPTAGDSIKVLYDGLLSKNGANNVYVHFGFGTGWNKASYFRMNKSSSGFEATLPVEYSDTLNICFKDCANNWDNNFGRNYSFDVNQ